MDKENERGPGREGKTISSAKRSDERTSRRTRCAVIQRNVESGILERYEGVMLRFSTTSTLLNLHTLSSCLLPCLSLHGPHTYRMFFILTADMPFPCCNGAASMSIPHYLHASTSCPIDIYMTSLQTVTVASL